MPKPLKQATKTKGQLTAQRILDAAEALFAKQGYDGTSLRQIADQASLKEPGLYNHFSGKQALYEAVLDRALTPISGALAEHLDNASGLRDYTEIPTLVTDLLLNARPNITALLQQAMFSDSGNIGNRIVHDCIEHLFIKGVLNLGEIGPDGDNEQYRSALAIDTIALFNLTIGFFNSQQIFASLAGGDLRAPENIALQKRLLHRVIRAMLIR